MLHQLVRHSFTNKRFLKEEVVICVKFLASLFVEVAFVIYNTIQL